MRCACTDSCQLDLFLESECFADIYYQHEASGGQRGDPIPKCTCTWLLEFATREIVFTLKIVMMGVPGTREPKMPFFGGRNQAVFGLYCVCP